MQKLRRSSMAGAERSAGAESEAAVIGASRPGGAPVDRAHGDGLGEACEEHGDAGLVGPLRRGSQHAAHHDVPHRLHSRHRLWL